MMRRLYYLATVLFWLVVFGFWLAGRGQSGEAAPLPEAPVAAAPTRERVIPLAEVARHARPDDCWMAIRGGVYDLSAYLPEHPTRPALIEPWCGREATEAYNTKTRGRPHSAAADDMLPQYRIGQAGE